MTSTLSAGQLGIAYMIIKNLEDLSDTAISIMSGLDSKQKQNFPDEQMLKLCIVALKNLYPKGLFTEDGFVYNKKVIQEFPYYTTAGEVYIGMKKKVTDDILKRIKDRDEKFFLDNYDTIFEEIINDPAIGHEVRRFRKFLGNDIISKADKESVWEFFDTIIDLVVNDKKYIKEYMK